MKRFIVVLDNSSKFDEEQFVNFCKNNGLGWWHWLNGLWLLTSHDETLSCVSLRESIFEAIGRQKSIMVFEVSSSHAEAWAGFGNKDMFEWLETTWLEE